MPNAFEQLKIEKKRTLFMFYGYRMTDGSQGGGYVKLANSLSEALNDLCANDGVAAEDGYFITDAFVEISEDGEPVIHVELGSPGVFLSALEDDDEDDDDA